MTNVDFEAQLNAKGAIIAENFTGVLNGNGRAIIGLNNVSVSNGNVSNFQGLALFKKISNATIKNINFAETDNNATKFVNIFAQKQANMLKYSLIAMTSTNSLIADVTMPKAIFVVEGSGMLQNDAYIGGLVAESYNTTFSGCIANITVEFNADFSTTLGSVYIGGLTGYAVDCKVQSSTRATTVGISVVQGKTNRRFKAIGGVAGYFEAENLAASIDGVEATVTQLTNIYIDHFGGIVGYAIGATITNCLAQGSIIHSALEKTNTGALVGQLQGGSVTDCTIKVVFDITISNYNYTNIGFVAGYVTSYNQVQANIANCKINQTFTNKTKISADHSSVEEMGIYGDGPTNYSPSGCTKID